MSRRFYPKAVRGWGESGRNTLKLLRVGKKKIPISFGEICIFPVDLCVSVGEIGISSEKICKSLKEIHISVGDSHKGKSGLDRAEEKWRGS